MNISKLTITPWLSGGFSQQFIKPTSQIAATLVKERLSMKSNDQTVARVFRKIPKELKGFVNPKSKVSIERKFSMDM